MKSYEVTAKKTVGDETKEATISVEFGETAEESIKAFGETVVNSNFIGAAKITAQAAMRRMLETGKDAKAITDAMAGWKPGVSLQRASDPAAAMLGKFAGMDKKAQAQFIAELQARAAGK